MKLAHRCARQRVAPGALAPLLAALLLAGCGGSAAGSRVAHLGASTGPGSATGSAGASSGSQSPEAAALAYARCMRSHGVPSFPDPSPGGDFELDSGSGVNPASPVFRTAQGECKALAPNLGGPPSVTHPSAPVLARFLGIAQCMRRQGIGGFPDPRTSVPADPFGAAGAGVISDIEGVIFVFPHSLDVQSPQFTRAAAACAFPLHNH